ncbi:MAG: hypothetical protein EWV52_14090 [Microcystis panniformis Mp_MB_F_20051200_S6D]|nr:MAG: hypothetical protein EWV52_14090 [Microcystis panniformis Mp_MB_F_20051200_S6D]
MSEKINSPSRINQIIAKAPQFSPNESTFEVWAKIFNIVEDRPTIKSTKVTYYLQLLQQEVLITREHLKKTNIPQIRYSAALSDLEEAFSPHWLTQPWNLVLQYLNTATVVSLGWVEDSLPSEENDVTESELEEVSNLINELELSLEDSKLPTSLILVIKNLIYLMREAIDRYPISGARALRSAMTNCYGELVLVKEELNKNPSDETSKLKKVWDKFTSVVENAGKVDSAISIGKKILEFSLTFLP